MAGSRRLMLYVTDIISSDNTSYKRLILSVDESNAKLTGGVEATPANIAAVELAGIKQDFLNIQYRQLLLEGKTTDGKTVRRSIIACDPENTLVANGGTTVMKVFVGPNTVEDVTMFVSGVVGEKRTFIRTIDTGLDDGTAT